MTAPALSTKLASVNRILAAVGQQPVASISGSLPVDVTAAVNALDEVFAQQIVRGWHFNYEEKVTLSKDGGGKIAWPANCLRVVIEKWRYANLDVTGRDDGGTYRLYDKVAHSFVFTTDLICDVVYSFDFESTPEAFRQYCTVRAARVLQDRMLVSPTVHSFTLRDEIEALKVLNQHESLQRSPNIFDNMAAYRVINRLYPNSGSGDLAYG
jgi:hypothetical protein